MSGFIISAAVGQMLRILLISMFLASGLRVAPLTIVVGEKAGPVEVHAARLAILPDRT